MTPEQIDLVQTSFKKIAPIAETAGQIFYDRLFEIAPDVRPLFPEVMTDQHKKLMQMIGVAVNNMERVEEIIPALVELGDRHKDYGVEDEYYPLVGSVLLGTLETALGDDFTPDAKAAWAKTYEALAGVMMGG